MGTYAAVVLLVALRHEPWRDEADVWLAARDMTPAQLFRWLGGAGTPGLWYLMVMPLAKLGLPYVSMTLLHVVLAIAACGLLVFAAPFPRWFKCLVAFSYPFCFQYAVVARTYVLDVLLLWLIAMALTARNRRMWVVGLLLFLLANANTHGLFIAAVIGLVVAIERVRERNVSADAIAGAVI
ncbi:MAG TPA: hypothetical protein VN541_00620, partial [Tepidisphaeraceae bacterium]|nr:hypothetical protein [Tepidisphaeraceae bacterium]